MASRGRRSAAALAVIPPQSLQVRPEPPQDLTVEQALEWKAIVGRMPADWFTRETHALLAQLCRHITASRAIAKRLIPDLSTDDLNTLLRMQEREGRAIEKLSRAMRLSQYSRYDKKKATGPTATRPWQG
jgi:hypothetical protein